ncbi:MAG: winged helix-turn-helix transcriptional regulator [Elusimicrobiota bacterium]|nr:MAG: winged helix-turn-helix transcriptional regulator [Elusimicrobiota bacterium]
MNTRMSATTEKNGLPEKEFLLIQELSRNPEATQRHLSESLGLSLGTTNLLIRRLARKGLLKVTQLDWKRTRYLLTLEGALEKSRKAFYYTRYTLRIFRQLQENIKAVLSREHASGRRDFVLVADDELLELLRETAEGLGLPGARFACQGTFKNLPAGTDLVFYASLETPPSKNGMKFVSVVDFDNIDYRVS